MRLCFMLHSLLYGVEWDYSWLAISPQELERTIHYYRRLGFRFVKASELFSFHDNVVCLTFDDGYRDNWTLAYPILSKLRVPFTVFINKDFIEQHSRVRALGDKQPGYLSVGEIRRMYQSGTVDIQSHSVTHTWYPISSKVIDIFNERQKVKYPWIMWNERGTEKPYWLSADYAEFIGAPVFENDRSLRAKRYIFDRDALLHFTRTVMKRGLGPEAANHLAAREYRNMGYYETTEEQLTRYRNEFKDNISFIRDILGYKPIILCWPGGASNFISEDVAYTYHTCTTINFGCCQDTRFLHRLSPLNPLGRDRFPWKYHNLTLTYYTLRYWLRSITSRARQRHQSRGVGEHQRILFCEEEQTDK